MSNGTLPGGALNGSAARGNSQGPRGGLDIVILGLSITSSWGNGHATTYRGLVRELEARGHRILFLERNVEWYASHRDLPTPPFGRTELYESVEELKDRFEADVRNADVVIVGSYVPDGVEVGTWACATAGGATSFYDIDTPVTLAKLARGDYEYLAPDLIRQYDLYLSFTGGPTLRHLEEHYHAPAARALYCSVDSSLYYPEDDDAPADDTGGEGKRRRSWAYDLAYMGTYSDDRQPPLDRLLIEPARRWREGRFAVAGPQYPDGISWPPNLERIDHLPPSEHRAFYNRQRFTLNVTRADMIEAGYAPSVRLFEAAACATPIISDYWKGLETLFALGTEILVSESPQDTLDYLQNMPEDERRAIGRRARARVMAEHTTAHRAAELERYLLETLERTTPAIHTRIKSVTS